MRYGDEQVSIGTFYSTKTLGSPEEGFLQHFDSLIQNLSGLDSA